MNTQIEKLYQIAQKNTRTIIGLMSGTSLDGLDIALCHFTGAGINTKVELRHFQTIPYPEAVKTAIRKVFAKQEVDFPYLCMLNPWVANLHADLVLQCLQQWQIKPADVDCIASHGQTVMHTPKRLHGVADFPNATLQIGDGDHLATKTGIITMSDFRQKHCALGGEGAPLAKNGDFLLFSSPTENRILINIGGIANYTYLPANGQFEDCFATDTGPGNTLIDAYCQQHFNLPYDNKAQLALQGQLISPLLNQLLQHSFFTEKFPKTTGPELLNLQYLEQAIKKINLNQYNHHDILYTLVHFSAQTLAQHINQNTINNAQTSVYLSGGGMHNPLLVSLLQDFLHAKNFKMMDSLGVNGDAKEAVLFAALANETLCGQLFSYGKISFPL